MLQALSKTKLSYLTLVSLVTLIVLSRPLDNLPVTLFNALAVKAILLQNLV